MEFVLSDAKINGIRLPNGSWTDRLGQIQSGIVDTFPKTWAYLDRFDDFAFTTPVKYEEVYALMLRPTSLLTIMANNVFQPVIYLLIISAIFALCFCEFLNENRHAKQVDDRVNAGWSQLHSLMPFNATWWRYQEGVTRKVLIMTGSAGLLLLMTFYQCNLLHQMLIPKPVPRIAIADIANSVESGQSKILFTGKNKTIEYEIMSSNISEITLLAAALRNNQAIYMKHGYIKTDIIPIIASDNAVFIENINDIFELLSKLPPDKCADYALVRVLLTSTMETMLISKRRMDIVEVLNIHIAERLEFLNRFIDEIKPHEICLRHMSDNPPDPIRMPLHLRSLSDSFAFLLFFLCFATLVFLVEVFINKVWNTQPAKHMDSEDDNTIIMFHLNKYSLADRDLIISLQNTLNSRKISSRHL